MTIKFHRWRVGAVHGQRRVGTPVCRDSKANWGLCWETMWSIRFTPGSALSFTVGGRHALSSRLKEGLSSDKSRLSQKVKYSELGGHLLTKLDEMEFRGVSIRVAPGVDHQTIGPVHHKMGVVQHVTEGGDVGVIHLFRDPEGGGGRWAEAGDSGQLASKLNWTIFLCANEQVATKKVL